MTEDKPWLSLPDEEPPERGLADLMAAARMKAEVMAHPPWWKRIFDLLRRPPVLALATIVVLLGGVIVVGRHPDRIVAPSEQPAATPPGGPEIRSETIVNEVAPPTAPNDSPHGVTAPKHVSKAPQIVKPEVKSEAKAGEAKLDDSEGSVLAAPDSTAIQAADEAPVQKGAVEKVVADPLARCHAAAVRKDCAGAKACAQEVEKASPAYYKANATRDAALKSCL